MLSTTAVRRVTAPRLLVPRVRAMRRLGCGPGVIEFYADHIEADAVHEQLVTRCDRALLAAEPELAADVVFGIQATTLLADRPSHLLLREWTRNRSTLRHPLPDAPASTPTPET